MSGDKMPEPWKPRVIQVGLANEVPKTQAPNPEMAPVSLREIRRVKLENMRLMTARHTDTHLQKPTQNAEDLLVHMEPEDLIRILDESSQAEWEARPDFYSALGRKMFGLDLTSE